LFSWFQTFPSSLFSDRGDENSVRGGKARKKVRGRVIVRSQEKADSRQKDRETEGGGHRTAQC